MISCVTVVTNVGTCKMLNVVSNEVLTKHCSLRTSTSIVYLPVQFVKILICWDMDLKM